MKTKMKSAVVLPALLAAVGSTGLMAAPAQSEVVPVQHKVEKIDGLDIFYREAGDPTKPALVLLHGFPTSSQMYRKVLHGLKDKYYLIAPDYPGFGESSAPSASEFEYSFDNLAKYVGALLEKKDLKSYTLMIQDYGAPVGFRIALKHPERVNGLVVMNGNAYEEGLGKEAWAPIVKMWGDRTPEIEQKISDAVFTLEGMRWQYTEGVRNVESVNPDNWNLDYLKISRPGQREIQLDLFYDYRKNVELYPAWQEYLRTNQPPALIVWGKNDAFFPEPGAAGYKRDLKDVDYNILDTGHFALEEEGDFIIAKMREFMAKISAQ